MVVTLILDLDFLSSLVLGGRVLWAVKVSEAAFDGCEIARTIACAWVRITAQSAHLRAGETNRGSRLA